MNATTQFSGVSNPFSLRFARPLFWDMNNFLSEIGLTLYTGIRFLDVTRCRYRFVVQQMSCQSERPLALDICTRFGRRSHTVSGPNVDSGCRVSAVLLLFGDGLLPSYSVMIHAS